MKKKALYFLFTVIFLLPEIVYGQNFKTINKKANELFLLEDYTNVIPLFLWMDSIAPGNGELNYKIAYAYLHTDTKSRALNFLIIAQQKGYTSPGMDFNFGIALHANSRFDEAIQYFDKAQAGLTMANTGDKKKSGDILKFKNMSLAGKRLMASPVDVKVENLGPDINSACPEYAPLISSDESLLIFTSRRPCYAKDGTKITSVFEDIFISEKDSSGKWKKAEPMDKAVNSAGHDASIALSPSGQTLLIYKDAGNGDIFESSRSGHNWSVAKRLPDPVNSSAWEPSASLSPDGKTLFFVSNRPGGFGGRDIYMTFKTGEGKWKKPRNLGNVINTAFDEDAPFIHPDGRTLYFSSESHETMGGFDIFSSIYTSVDSSWSKPINIGYPINTIEDDLFLVWSADGKRAYYASEKTGGYGDKDIYQITTNKKELSLILMKGVVFGKNLQALKAKITITDNETGNSVATAYSDDSTGKYTLFLVPGKSYGIAVEANKYVPHSENIDISDNAYLEITRNIELAPIERGNRVILNNVFYESGKADLKKESVHELIAISKFLKKNNNLVVEIAGHTDNVGEESGNQTLSENRAKTVVAYLTRHGVKKENLKAAGYGESEPVAPNTTEAGRKLNRRTELRIIDNNSLINK